MESSRWIPHEGARGYFLFEGPYGQGKRVSEEELLKHFLRLPEVQLVVFSACLSAKQEPGQEERGLEQAFYRKGVPYVVGMREKVFDQAGIKFAQVFLQELAAQRSVEEALQEARRAIADPNFFLAGGVYRYQGSSERARISLGQWCLPELWGHEWGRDLIDWNFEARGRPKRRRKKKLIEGVVAPEEFRGRRRELRRYERALVEGRQKSLLITGAGGMGKTALACKLLALLEKHGYKSFVFSAQEETFKDFLLLKLELELADDPQWKLLRENKDISREKKISFLLERLLERFGGKIAFLLDNLESLQEKEHPHALQDKTLSFFLKEARKMGDEGLVMLATSRWRLPAWPEEELCALGKPVYGDFLAVARTLNLPPDFLKKERLQRAYKVLGGNFRALEYYAQAVKNMSEEEEASFEKALSQAQEEIQVNMALEKLWAGLTDGARELLRRATVYEIGVPDDGLKKVAWVAPQIEDVETCLEELLGVSLLEEYLNEEAGQKDYEVSPLVRAFVEDKCGGLVQKKEILQAAAEYLRWQLKEGQRRSWGHILATQRALARAGREEEAAQVVLEWIAGPMERAGAFQELLEEWLKPLEHFPNKKIRAVVLNLIGKQHHNLGNYQEALHYLEQALKIRREIGDRAGEGTTLNNIGLIHHNLGNYQEALHYLEQALKIRREIGDRAGEGISLFNLGHIHRALGEPDRALRCWGASFRLAKATGHGALLKALEDLARLMGGSGLEFWEEILAKRKPTEPNGAP